MIVVCWKWTGATSASDRAALEVALRMPPPVRVTVVTVGAAPADAALREALAVGATAAVRIDAPADLRSDAVARALAPVCTGASWVVCGDASADRGSGSVPAFLAAELGVGQALGLVSVAPRAQHGVRAVRRLDGGRREVLDAVAGSVLSVEGAAADLRRASLPAELRAQRAVIDVRRGPAGPVEPTGGKRPYRPRPRVHPCPTGDAALRIRELTGLAGGAAASGHNEVVTLDPPQAAAHIVARLRTWGYLESEDGEP